MTSEIKKIAVSAAVVAALAIRRGIARENDALDEARAEASCSFGVGCGTSGVCYAEAHGQPESCGRTHDRQPLNASGLNSNEVWDV